MSGIKARHQHVPATAVAGGRAREGDGKSDVFVVVCAASSNLVNIAAGLQLDWTHISRVIYLTFEQHLL